MKVNMGKFSIALATGAALAVVIVYQNIQIVRAGYRMAKLESRSKDVDEILERRAFRINEMLSPEKVAQKVLDLNIPVSLPAAERTSAGAIDRLAAARRPAGGVVLDGRRRGM